MRLICYALDMTNKYESARTSEINDEWDTLTEAYNELAESEPPKFSVDIESITGADLSSAGLDHQTTFTPQISELKITTISPIDLKRRMSEIAPKIHANHYVDESDMRLVSDYIRNEHIPLDYKEEFLPDIDENFKSYEFNRFFADFVESYAAKSKADGVFFIDPMEDLVLDFKINGVPYKDDNTKPGLADAYQFFTDTEKPVTAEPPISLLAYQDFINSNADYFQSQIISASVRSKLEQLRQISPQLEAFKEAVAKKVDESKIEAFKEINRAIAESPQQEHDDIRLDDSFKAELLSNMPAGYDTLEKSIYAYMKLCNVFSYASDYYYSGDNNGHLNIERINKLNADNNAVVCYEFAYALEDILRDFGVPYSKKLNINPDGSFKNEHANTSFLIDDSLLIFADSTTTVEQGDLVNVKLARKTKGIRCENCSRDDQQRFREALEKVLKQINSEIDVASYNRIMDKYKSLDKTHNLSQADKINFIFSELENTNLTGLDLFSAEDMLEEDILNKNERLKKVFVFDSNGSHVNFSTSDHSTQKRVNFSYDLQTRQITA